MRDATCIPGGPIAAILLVGMLACAPARTVDPRQGLDDAVGRFVAGDYAAAVDRLNAVIDAAADDAVRREAYGYLGRSYMAMGNTEAAIDAFMLGVRYGDRGPCVEYLELLRQYQEGSPEGLHIREEITRGELAGAAVRMLTPGDAPDPTGPTPLERLEAKGWLPAPADGLDHASEPVTTAALYVFVARVLADAGLPGRAGDVMPGGYRRAVDSNGPVSGREALAVLERMREMQERNGR